MSEYTNDQNTYWPEMSKTPDGPTNTVETAGEPVYDRRIRTHYMDCWRAPSHHGCCVARVERLERELSAAVELAAIREEQLRDELARVERLTAERNILDDAVNALVEERDQYDADLEQCHGELATALMEAADAEEELSASEKESWALFSDVAELHRELSAAEARERKVIEQMRKWMSVNADVSRTLRKYIAILDNDHTALDVVLEARTIETLNFIRHSIADGGDVSCREWSEAELDALGEALEAHDAALDQAKSEARLELLDEIAVHMPLEHIYRLLDELGAPQTPDESHGWRWRIRAMLEQAQAEERERCCAAVCPYCAGGYPVELVDGQWCHPRVLWAHSSDYRIECDADAIRNQEDQ